jgi:hypothetical protein
MVERVQHKNIAGPLAGVFANPLMRFLRLNGTGTHEMAANHASTDASFRIQPPAGAIWLLEQFVWLAHVSDGPLVAGDYGDIEDGLTDGFLVRYSRGGEVLDALDGVPIKTNADLVRHFGWTSTPNLTVPATAALALVHGGLQGIEIALSGDDGDYLEVVARDDLSDLESHSVKAIGYQIAEP